MSSASRLEGARTNQMILESAKNTGCDLLDKPQRPIAARPV